MNSPEFKNTVCRICLDENVAFDWNNSLIEHNDLTYKECYYKYTQLKQLDDDPLSSMLCKSCSNGLEEMHSLIMKALDSHNFLLEVNCVNMDIEDSIIVEDNENCASTDFETVLVEKHEPDSVMLEQFEYESFDEFSIKSEDESNLAECFDEMQYQEMLEIEGQDEFDENNEVISKMYEIRKSKKTCKRKFEDDDPKTKIELRKSKLSYSRHKIGENRMETENKYESCDDYGYEKTHNYINIEKLQYEGILEDEEYEESHETDGKNADEDISALCKAKRNYSEDAISIKKNLDKDADLNKNITLKKSALFNNQHKNISQELKLQNEKIDVKLKNCRVPKRSRSKTKKNNHLNSQNTPRMCSYCSKILHNKYALQKHEKTHLANRERKAPCPICGVKFLEESYVKIHMQIHNQDRVKKHQCEFCDKAFYEKGSLNVHRRIHLGQMIPCTLCSKEFFRQVDLDIHMNSHSAAVINAETKKRSRYWVNCKYCHKDIMSTSFKYHMAVHLKEPQMRCSICDREFFRRDSCTDHLRTVHKKTTEEYSNYIILYNKNRLSHLYLEQTTELKK